MRITRRYGQTRADLEQRQLIKKAGEGKGKTDIVQFAQKTPELLVAQWASALDKIATKPRGTEKPTEAQRDFRERLGGAFWDELRGFIDTADHAEMKKLWFRKVHPYPKGTDGDERDVRKTRWYESFCGDIDPAQVNPAAVAAKVKAHLHEKQLRLNGAQKRKGLIVSRAESIAKNVLKLKQDTNAIPEQADYCVGGVDPIAEIHRSICKPDKGNVSPRQALHISAEKLRAHFGRLFGEGASIDEARTTRPELFALHEAVKSVYRRRLKRCRKKRCREKGYVLDKIIPRNWKAMYGEIGTIATNRSCNHDIRLGKVIHYHLLEKQGARSFAMPKDEWEGMRKSIETSDFWHTKKQIYIKQAEAFVRVWRGGLALMARSLRDISPPDLVDRDILYSRDTALARFNDTRFQNQIKILYGNEVSKKLLGDAEQNKALFQFMLEKTAAIRDSIFHFKDMATVKGGLENLGTDQNLQAKFNQITQDHQQARIKHIADELAAAQLCNYATAPQIEAIFTHLTQANKGAQLLPLPRFKRMIERGINVGELTFAHKLNRTNFEADENLRCQYIVLKSLYDSPFRMALKKLKRAELKTHIEESIKRANNDTKKINKTDELSRVQKVLGASQFDDLADFLDRLTAEMASEMRVQKGYEPDADKAQGQARFIDNLRCEVIARAFKKWLEDENLTWLLKNPLPDAPDPAASAERLKELHESVEVKTSFTPWQSALYILLYLLPINAASALRHQLRKWVIVRGKTDHKTGIDFAEALEEVFDLYIVMHDAVHTGGGAALPGQDELKELFENPADFDKVFPASTDPAQAKDSHLPIRGLRELLRFGGFPILEDVFKAQKISSKDVDAWSEQKDTIKDSQQTREELHAKLSRKKGKPISEKDAQAYKDCNQKIVAYRQLAAQVTFTNHLRLHYLLMAVLGRLVDYAGLWERDLYFRTLARLYHENKAPCEVFEDEGNNRLNDGRIVDAFKKLKPEAQDKWKEFPSEKGKQAPHWRNNFAHFNMLRQPNELNLTSEINHARGMMAYDRKLKNAVAKSIIDLLAREGLILRWQMDVAGKLGEATIKSKTIKHLGGKGGDEALQGEQFVKMAARLFNGKALPTNSGAKYNKQKKRRQKR